MQPPKDPSITIIVDYEEAIVKERMATFIMGFLIIDFCIFFNT